MFGTVDIIIVIYRFCFLKLYILKVVSFLHRLWTQRKTRRVQPCRNWESQLVKLQENSQYPQKSTPTPPAATAAPLYIHTYKKKIHLYTFMAMAAKRKLETSIKWATILLWNLHLCLLKLSGLSLLPVQFQTQHFFFFHLSLLSRSTFSLLFALLRQWGGRKRKRRKVGSFFSSLLVNTHCKEEGFLPIESWWRVWGANGGKRRWRLGWISALMLRELVWIMKMMMTWTPYRRPPPPSGTPTPPCCLRPPRAPMGLSCLRAWADLPRLFSSTLLSFQFLMFSGCLGGDKCAHSLL